MLLPPPLAIPHPLQSPPPPRDRHFHGFLVNIYCAGLCCPSALHMAFIAFPLLQINHLCVFCDVFSPKALYGCVVLLFRPKMFSPGDCVPLTVPLTHTWCTCGGHCCGPFTKWAAVLPHLVHSALGWSLRWIMRAPSFSLKARRCGGTTVCLEISLQSPPPTRETVSR